MQQWVPPEQLSIIKLGLHRPAVEVELCHRLEISLRPSTGLIFRPEVAVTNEPVGEVGVTANRAEAGRSSSKTARLWRTVAADPSVIISPLPTAWPCAACSFSFSKHLQLSLHEAYHRSN